MPASCAQATFEILVKSLYIPTQMIQKRKIRGGKLYRVQKGCYQPASSKAVPVHENHPDRNRLVAAILLYSAQVIAIPKFAQHLWPEVLFGRNDELNSTAGDFCEGGERIETCVEKEQVTLFEIADQFWKEPMFRGGRAAVDKAQGSATDNVKQAAEFNGDGP